MKKSIKTKNRRHHRRLKNETRWVDPAFRLPTAQEIARRALIVYVLSNVGSGYSRDVGIRWLQAEGLWADLSPQELAFIQNPHPTEQDRINFHGAGSA